MSHQKSTQHQSVAEVCFCRSAMRLEKVEKIHCQVIEGKEEEYLDLNPFIHLKVTIPECFSFS